MKKSYNTPEMLAIALCSGDIITGSPITAHEDGGTGDLDFFEFPC